MESWQTPLTYLSQPEKGDVLTLFAGVKAAKEGHLHPFLFTNVPELGAPYIANWDDFPVTEKPLIYLTGFLARFIGLFAAANFAVMLAQVLAALSFYAACRMLDSAWHWSLAGALVFAFSRFAFAHGLHHLTVTWYWHVPLDLVVCAWIFRGEEIRPGGPRFFFALAVAFLTGIQNVYYTSLFLQFILIGGLVQAWRRGWRASLPAAAIIATTVAAFLLMNLNTLFYHLLQGGNAGAIVRNYQWLEIYGLKLVDLVVPPPDHPFPLFAWWGANHVKEVLLSPGEAPPSAYLGLIGLAALGWLALVSVRNVAENKRVPLEAWLILWIFLYAEVGGLNGIIGALGWQLFRATTRYSIVILGVALMYAVGRLSLKVKPSVASYAAAFLLALIALWDQTPPIATARDLAETAQAVASDRAFTEKLEARLPPHAMVFQLPIMAFPEGPVSGVGSYDHFRPYLYSHTLRFSFGSDKGRPQADWQRDLPRMPFLDAVHQLEDEGFSALYVNRNGFADKGEFLIKTLQSAGLNDLIENDRGTLFCVLLKPSAQPVLPVTR